MEYIAIDWCGESKMTALHCTSAPYILYYYILTLNVAKYTNYICINQNNILQFSSVDILSWLQDDISGK